MIRITNLWYWVPFVKSIDVLICVEKLKYIYEKLFQEYKSAAFISRDEVLLGFHPSLNIIICTWANTGTFIIQSRDNMSYASQDPKTVVLFTIKPQNVITKKISYIYFPKNTVFK